METQAPQPTPSPPASGPYYQPPSPEAQDEGYLKALEICYYVWAGLHGLGILFLIFHASVMTFAFSVIPNEGPEAPPFNPLVFIGFIYAIFGIFALTGAILSFLCGRAIAKRERKVLIMITAGICCIGFPIGTALGVCTFIVLSRPSVQARFAKPSAT